MGLQDKKAYSRVQGIRHIATLADLLEIDTQELLSVADAVESHWKPGKKLYKKNGEPRITHDAKFPLKNIHEKIKNKLLRRVIYPPYLLGGISDRLQPRDYKRHAAIHSGKQVLISEDIANFFPATSPAHVHGIWQGLFQFHPELARVLTLLTTHDNMLPQGWKTSGYLANLVFWNTEPSFVCYLERKGYFYSRFMDDITVSARRKMSRKDKQEVVSSIYKMLFQKDYQPRRDKHQISHRAQRMEVTGLIVNSGRPTMPKKKRNDLRALIHACEKMSKNGRGSDEYKALYNKTSGKVAELKRFHADQAGEYRRRLRIIKPI